MIREARDSVYLGNDVFVQLVLEERGGGQVECEHQEPAGVY